VWWVAGAVKAWHLFNARSKDAPLFLTWKYQFHDSARDAFMDTETPRKIRRLDFSGSRTQLERLLATSIRVVTGYSENGEHTTHFFSLPFPKLLELDIVGLLPDYSSSIFTTLTSLKLVGHWGDDKPRYTRSQFSQILQQHPNLRRLDLRGTVIPLAEQSGPPISVVLSQLVDLKLDGTTMAIAGFMDLVSMSPLHNVDICTHHAHDLSILA